MPRSVRHVVFDIGGVLVSHVQSWREAHERTALPWDDYFASDVFFQATRNIARRHQIGDATPEEFYAEVVRASDGRYDLAGARLVLEAWMLDEYPGVGEVIDAIHAREVATALLSNTNPVHWEQIFLAYPVLTRVQHAHASHLLRAWKPERAIFEAFERETGFDRSGVLFFDDVDANVAAAVDYGWRAEVIDHAGDPAAQLRAHLVRHGVLDS